VGTARRIAFAVAVGTIALLAWGEFVHARATRRELGRSPGSSGTGEAVVVLGYGNRGERANALNRWRVRAGIRSRDPQASRSVLVFTGGIVHGTVPEAELMARYARDELGDTGEHLIERESRSTWENVRNVIPLIEHADRIKIVSNALHAEKARAYLRRLRPDLADRLVAAQENRIGELTALKPIMAVMGLRNLRALRAGHGPAPDDRR
jgi:uncharacterized SAM-binding protein YcdF (DUF218 family)